MKVSKQQKIIYILIAAVIVCAGLLLTAILMPQKQPIGEFVPPPFDENAVTGTPTPPEQLYYSELFQEGMAYRFGICMALNVEQNRLRAYFSNVEGNEVWLKIRVISESGDTLGESGLLKPGEYVEYIKLSDEAKPGTKVTMLVMGYEPETYYSAGSVPLVDVVLGG